VWIAADARLDDRDTLVGALAARGRANLAGASDAELLLHAYHAWGDRCPEHLLGDFAFAVWDGPARRLFCARDHFGVKPFYYAHADAWFAFANGLDCLRLHPSVGRRLNEQAILDFLVAGVNGDPATTCFADVRRLPAGHALTWHQGAPRVWRYWTLPVDGHVRFRRTEDYVERFLELLGQSVGDRLRGARVGVLMSGGLDSAAVAAFARRHNAVDLRAHTVVYDHLIPDEERRYSSLVARHLGIPVHHLAADDHVPFAWRGTSARLPEPEDNPFRHLWIDLLTQAAVHGRVLLSGEGGDEVLKPSWVANLIGGVPWTELATDVTRALVLTGRRPPLGIRAKVRAWLGAGPAERPRPPWLMAEPGARLADPGRWTPTDDRPMPCHRRRPDAYRSLTSPLWPPYLSACDPGVTGVPVEVRFPYLDVRLVEFMLSVPAIPWCTDKMLLRLAMRGLLPDEIRDRPKAPLQEDPTTRHLRGPGLEWLDRFEPDPQLGAYVAREKIPPMAGRTNEPHECWANLRPLSLNMWLEHLASADSSRGQP
jgi:asparagine synthase (glutamine-hydrolysing)